LIYVGGEGPSNAQLAAVGEAPGGEEEDQQRPFVGASGKLFNKTLSEAGGSRESIYVTNVVKVRPPSNKIKDLHLIGRTIEEFIPQLENEMRALKPNCILALGATALEALTGKKGIEKHRGSILPCRFGPYKVVPTIHPASLLHSEAEGKMHSWKDLTYIRWDIERALLESQTPEYCPPQRNLQIAKNAQQLYSFLKHSGQYCSVDIETFRTIPICISLAFNCCDAISVPLMYPPGIDKIMTDEDQTDCWYQVAQVLADLDILKIGQNFKFDEKQLMTCLDGKMHINLKVRSFFFDTLLAFRVLYPELPGALQFSTSVLTKEPYYKDEGKEYNPKRDRFDRLLLYNAKDAAVTYEVFERESEELKNRGLEEFFYREIMPLHYFYSRIESRGILRDDKSRSELRAKYMMQWEDLQDELNLLTSEYLPEPVNVMSNSAKGDIPKLIYGYMKCPARKGVDDQTLDALRRNAIKDQTKKRILELIPLIRKVRKTIGTYIDANVDYRGRLCTGYRIALETGRTSTSVLKAPVATEPMGIAFQTITKHGDVGADMRRMFVPDPGYAFIEPDLNGAEARVVAILANDLRLIKAFKYNVDIHRLTKAWIDFNSPDDLLSQFWESTNDRETASLARQINSILKVAISDEERQLGKKFRHAANYAMGKREAAVQANISEYKAARILEAIHKTNPNIQQVFHKEIQETLAENGRRLMSPNGRERLFLNQWGDELFKEAYAQIPQSTVSDQTKQAARMVERRLPWVQILVECHDSFLCQVPIARVDETIPVIREELERPIDFSRCSLPRGALVIPCEIKIGDKNWEEMCKI